MGRFNYSSLTVSASFRVSLLFAPLRLCEDQAICAQPEALGRTNRHAVMKKLSVVVQILNKLSLKTCISITLAPLLHNFEIMLSCTSQNEQIKLLEIFACFNCVQVCSLVPSRAKQSTARSPRNLARNIAATRNPLPLKFFLGSIDFL